MTPSQDELDRLARWLKREHAPRVGGVQTSFAVVDGIIAIRLTRLYKNRVRIMEFYFTPRQVEAIKFL